jgi:hypothetical protein
MLGIIFSLVRVDLILGFVVEYDAPNFADWDLGVYIQRH